jgi:spore germination cell wall hydrolase CwlJ-like protein
MKRAVTTLAVAAALGLGGFGSVSMASYAAGGGIATGTDSIAVGNASSATGIYSTALGNAATASAGNDIALGHNSAASGGSSTAVGNGAVAAGSGDVALGPEANASTGGQGIAIGWRSKSTGDAASIAIGAGSVSSGKWSTALGVYSTASKEYDTALGSAATATGGRSTALGHGAKATDYMSVAIGEGSEASSENSIAVGNASSATGIYSTALGNNSAASGKWSTALGNAATASAGNDIALGNNSAASGGSSTAVGNGAVAAGSGDVALGPEANASTGGQGIAIGWRSKSTGDAASIAIGAGSVSSGKWSTALGVYSTASKEYDTALGSAATATGGRSTALGHGAKATDYMSVAIGEGSEASSENSIAVGYATHAQGTYSIALGRGSTVSNKFSVALGPFSMATTDYSVALGDSTTTRDASGVTSTAINGNTYTWSANGNSPTGVVSVGAGTDADTTTATRQIINVANGVVSADSTDAINGSQLYAVADQVGTNAKNIATNATNITNLTNTVNAGWEADVNGTKLKSVTSSSPKLNFVQGSNMVVTGSGDNVTIATSTTPTFTTVTAGTAKMGQSSDGNSYVTGLDNTSWNVDNPTIVSGRAATEDELYQVNKQANKSLTFAGNTGSVAKKLGEQLNIVGTGSDGLYLSDNVKTEVDSEGNLLIKSKNTYTTGVTVDSTKKKATFTRNDGQSYSLNFGDMGLSTTDYRLVGSKNSTTGKYTEAYTVDADHTVALNVQDPNTGDLDQVKITGLATTSDVTKAATEVKAGTNVTSVDKTADATDGHSVYTVNVKDMAAKSGTVTYGTDGTGTAAITNGDGSTASISGLKNTYTTTSTLSGTKATFTRNDGETYDLDLSGLKTALGTADYRLVGSGTDQKGAYTVGDDNKVNLNVYDPSSDTTNTVEIDNIAKATDVGSVANIKTDGTGDTSGNTVVSNINDLYKLSSGGLTIAGDTNTTGTSVGLGNKVSIVGNGNTATTGYSSTNVMTNETADGNGAKVQILMSDTPTFTSATVGGVAIKDGKVTNLTAGTADTDAVNYSQIKDLVNTDGSTKTLTFAANSGTAFKSNPDSTITVKGTGTKDDSSYSSDNIKTVVDANGNITVMMDKELTSDTLTVGQDGKDGTIGVNGADGISGVGIDGKDGISIKGADGKDGVTIYSKDGDNGSEGHIGLTGPAGTDGKNATADISVKDGAAGVDGTTLTRVVYEDGNGKEHQVATLDDGMKYDGDTGTGLAMKLNSTVNVKGGVTDTANLSDNNIGVVSDGTDTLNIKLAKDLSGLTSATFDSGVKIGKDGIDAGSKTITGVATPVNGTDAANKDYVDSTAASSDTHVKSGTYAVATSGTDKNTVTLDMVKGSTDLTDKVTITGVATTADLKNLSGDTTNAVLYDGTAKDTVTLAGASGTTITNVAKGVNDTDAVNYSQIKNLVNSDGSTKTLTFAANSGTAFKSNPDSTITVKGTGTKDDSNYSSENIKTTVDADGNITVMMDKDISAGTIGVAGKDGKDGVTIYATDGKDGSEGHIGLTGPAGADGKNATADISVKDGAAGVDGTTLTRVVYEDRNGTEHQVATLDDGMKYAGDTGTGLAMKLNSTVNVKGGVTDTANLSDNNIGVVSDGTDTLTIKLAKDLTGLTSVTSDTVTADTIKAGDTVTLSKDGIDAGSKTITNVASGTNDGDAVNYSQIKDLVNSDGSTKTLTFAANSGTAFKSNPDSTITVKGTGTKDDSSYSSDNIKTVVDGDGNITVMMDKELTSDKIIVGKDGKDGSIGVNGADGISGVGIDGKDGISIKGADGKDGVTIYSKDGVDGSEGHIGLTGPAGADGKNATADISVKDGEPGVDGTTLTRVVYEDRNGTEHQVATLDDGMKYVGDTGTGLAMKLNSTVNVKGGVTDTANLSDNNIGVVSDGTDTLNIKLAKDLTGLTSVTSDTVTADTIKAGDTVTLSKDGIDAGSKTITNVASGSNDTDAVNYSQIKDLVNSDGSTKTLTFAANSGTAFKSNPDSTITVKGTGTKDDSNYSSDNIKTTVDADGNITVMMDKDISAGTIGVAGKDGKDGVTIYATDGKDGSEGHIGLTGPAGADGKNATADISVKDGAAGVDGTTLTRVVYEDRNGTEHQVATLDDGMKYAGDTGSGLAMKLNSTVNVKGGVTDTAKLSDNNIGVVSDGTDTLNIKLAKDLTGLTSVSADTIKAGDTVTLSKDGIDAGSKTITNVASGTNDGDAVNYSQIKDLVNTDGSTKTLTFAANSGTAFKSNPDSTITVKGTGTKDDSSYSSDNIKTTVDANGNITVMMDKELTSDTVIVGQDGKDGTIGVNGADGISGVGIDGKDGISIKGADGKDGVTIYSKDGVDGSEGHIGLTGPAGADGKNATADISVKDGAAGVDGTTLTRVVYEDRNGTEHQVATLDDGMKYDGDTGTGLAMKLNSTVNVKGGVTDTANLSDGNIGVVSDGTDTLNIKLAKDLTGLTSVSADTIKAGDTVTLSKDGIDAGSKTITNVASGTNDGDAVNYSQIKDLVNTDGSTKTLTFAANSGTAFKSNPDSTITVKGTGTKDDSNYSSDNIKTTVDANGNITVMMDKELTSDTVIVGQDGKDGTIGVNGADGISGVGIDGKDGISIKGADGKDGVTIYSKDGADGSEGHIGLTGPAGTDGKNATADISVKDGAAGVDGTTLTRVVYEDRNGTEHQVATLDDGMKYDGDTGTGLAMKLNSTVNVKGGVTDETKLSDGNIGVVSDGTDTLNIKLAKDLTGLTSVTSDTVTADTIKAGDTVTLSKDGIDAGSKTITNVASGANDGDAVNYSQIKDLVNSDGSTKTLTFAANSGTAFKSNPDSTITVKGTGTKDDSNYSSDNIKTTVDADGNITVMMDKDISAGTIGVAGKDGKDGVTIYATDGKDGSEGHIGLTGPAGADGKNATADISVKDGAAGVDGTTLTRVVYEDRNGTEHQVATLDDGMKYAGDTGTGLAMKLNSTVNVKGGVTDETKLSDGNIGVVSDGTDTLNIKLAKDLTGLTSVSADTIKAGDTVTLSKDGIDAGSKTITNVASGSNDTDAVNYSQIKNLVNSDGSTKTLTFAANSGTAFKSNPDSTITVKGTGTKDDSNYSSDNIKTTVDADGNITVMMDKDISAGTIGVAGKDGKDGVTIYATDGKDGSEGHIGLTGPAGADGKNATADISVKDGAAGVDGTTLTRVVYEDRNGKEHQVATLDDGMKYDGDTGTGLAMKLNSTVNVKGGVTDETKLSDNNIGVVSDGTDTLNIKLAKDLTGLTSVTSDTVTADTIKAGDTVTLSKDGIDAGSKTITNVASGSNDGDAVNYSQIKDLVNTDGSTKTLTFAANSGTAFKSNPDSTITVKGTGTKDDSNYSSDNIKTVVDANGNITVMMDKELTSDTVIVGQDGKDGTIGVNGADGISGVGIDGKDGISIKGADGKDGVTIYSKDGADGSEGHIGLTGPAGTDGKNATADISVKDGAAGVDGTTLTRVVYEDRNGTEHQVATLDDGMKYAGDTGTGLSMKLNSTVNVKGGVTDETKLSDNNIGVVSDGTDTLSIKLAKDLIDLNSATFGSGSSAVTISSSGIDNGGNKISNIANGTEAGDAVNYNQLKAVSDKVDTTGTEAAKHSSVTASDSNITVTTGTNENGGTDYKVGLSDSVNVNKDLTVGTDSATQVKLDGETGTITAGKVTVDGSAGTVTGLTNTTWDANNITSGQAATEDQLKAAVSAGTQEAKDSDTHVKEGTYTASDGTVTMDLVNGKGESTGSQVIINDVASKAQQDTNTTNINNGWNAQIDGTTVNNVTPSNNNMNFVTGDNIVLSNSDNGIKISTSKNISVDTVKVGDKVSISSDGIDAGGTKVTNIAEGDVTATSTDAVNGSQLYSVEQKIDSTYGDTITKIGNSVNKLGDRVDKVGAGAAALAALHPLDFDPDDKWDFAAGYGHYNGKNAASVGAFYRPNEDTMFSVGASVGNGENMINAGVSFKLGQGNHVSTSRVAMAKEIIDMRNQMKQMSDMMHSMLKTIDPTKSAEFPDVPENHWAYEYVSKLAGNGIVEGYPDGNFKGDRTMTRYEMAAMLYRALEKGVNVDGRMLKEFQPELERIRVDRVSNAPIDRVRVIKGQG